MASLPTKPELAAALEWSIDHDVTVMQLCEVGLPIQVANILEYHLGLVTVDQLAQTPMAKVMSQPGMGKSRIRTLFRALARVRELDNQKGTQHG